MKIWIAVIKQVISAVLNLLWVVKMPISIVNQLTIVFPCHSFLNGNKINHKLDKEVGKVDEGKPVVLAYNLRRRVFTFKK